MTSLVAWAACDTRGPASLNIASDSRISWSRNGVVVRRWDEAKKVFASANTALVIGYVGDVLFPALVLPGLIDRVDRDVFPAGEVIPGLLAGIRRQWSNFPAEERRPVTIYIGCREGQGMAARFKLVQLTNRSGTKDDWRQREIPVPSRSACLAVDGSGRGTVQRALDAWQRTPAAETSRAVFSGFVDAVVSSVDPATGGAPQLASLYRVGPGRLMGIIHEDKRYFGGTRLIGDEFVESIEWRNALFERADGRTKTRLNAAQRHTRPDAR